MPPAKRLIALFAANMNLRLRTPLQSSSKQRLRPITTFLTQRCKFRNRVGQRHELQQGSKWTPLRVPIQPDHHHILAIHLHRLEHKGYQIWVKLPLFDDDETCLRIDGTSETRHQSFYTYGREPFLIVCDDMIRRSLIARVKIRCKKKCVPSEGSRPTHSRNDRR